MKSITEIAKEIGVSRQAVHQKINKEPLSSSLQPFTSTVKKTKYYNDEGVSLIKSAFLKDGLSTVSTKTVNQIDNKSSTVSTTLTDALQAQINNLMEINSNITEQNKELNEQLSKERKHSREQADKLTELAQQLAQLASNAQKLHATDIIPRLNDNTSNEPPEPLEPQPPQKENIFKRIFGKRI